MPPAGLSVVVPSYRRPDALKRCLRALAGQSLAPLEILVVLRADDAESRIALSEVDYPVEVVIVDQPGQVAALNRGCEAARGEFIAITDDDAAPRPNWLLTIAARFETDARIGAVGGRDAVHVDGRIVDGKAPTVGRVLWWGRLVGNHHLRSHHQDVDFLKGGNMALRATARRPFDHRLRGEGAQVCNDLEVTWSIRRRGWRVLYDDEIVVDHYPAHRHDDDSRDQRSRRAQLDEEHNEAYALLLHASWWQRPILLGYRLLVGKRRAPGLLLGAVPCVAKSQSIGTWSFAVARLSAVRTVRSALRLTPA